MLNAITKAGVQRVRFVVKCSVFDKPFEIEVPVGPQVLEAEWQAYDQFCMMRAMGHAHMTPTYARRYGIDAAGNVVGSRSINKDFNERRRIRGD